MVALIEQFIKPSLEAFQGIWLAPYPWCILYPVMRNVV